MQDFCPVTDASRKVALIVESPHRDIPGIVLIAHRLCQAGITCYLVPFPTRWEEIWALAPDLVLLSNLHRSNASFAKALVQAGICFGILDTEGGVFTNPDWYGFIMAQDAQLRHQAAFYCSWGPYLAEQAVHSGWYLKEQVRVTGTPRTDFYSADWRVAVLDSSSYAEPYSQGDGMVLLNANFPAVNPLNFPTEEANIQNRLLHYEDNRRVILGYHDIQRETLRQFVELANHLAERFPQAHFVYRPHPNERVEGYQGLLKPYPNLHLIKQGTVEGWIFRAKVVIQRGCSTAIEAGLAGVPTLSPDWIPCAFEMPTVEEVSVHCLTRQDLEGHLGSILAQRFQIPQEIPRRLQGIIRDWFFRIDGEAHERVADHILEHLKGCGHRPRLNKCRDMAYTVGWPMERLPSSRWVRMKERGSSLVRRYLGLPAQWSFRNGRRMPRSHWETSGKYFDDQIVREISGVIHRSTRHAGTNGHAPVGVQLARERRDYFLDFHGGSVTLFPSSGS